MNLKHEKRHIGTEALLEVAPSLYVRVRVNDVKFEMSHILYLVSPVDNPESKVWRRAGITFSDGSKARRAIYKPHRKHVPHFIYTGRN